VLSAGPASHPIGEFVIDLARPRDVAEVRVHAPLHRPAQGQIWNVLREEVLKGYAQQKQAADDVERHPADHENLRIWQVGVLVILFLLWHVLTKPGLIPPLFFDSDNDAKFFFGEPVKILLRIWDWFIVDRDIYQHLWVTLLETVLAFAIGTASGLIMGMWLALSPLAAAILDPYIKAMNSMPRVILAPIFAVWFGLGLLPGGTGFHLVFFIVFFNVYQGVKEVSPTVLRQRPHARRLAAGSCCGMCTC